MRVARRSVRLLGALAASLVAVSASAAAAELDAEDRAFLASSAPGSLAKPEPIASAEQLEALCEAVKAPLPSSEAAEADAKGPGHAARRSVYSVRIEPERFELGDYDPDEDALPLRLRASLSALEGALSLTVMNRDAGAFELEPEEAEGIRSAVRSKRAALEVVFVLEGANEDLAPCFSVAKSEAFSVRAEALSFEVVDVETGASLARARTPALERLRRWLAPGDARVGFEVTVLDGTVPREGLADAVEARRDAFLTCLEPLTGSAAQTGVVALAADIDSRGAVRSAKAELDSVHDDEVVRCLERALAGVAAPKSPKPSRAHVVVSVDRGAPGDG